MTPKELKYAESHEWVKLGDNGEITVGITAHAVSQLSDLVHIDFPRVGDKVDQGSAFGQIESVKTVADLIAPATGTITAVNRDLSDTPEIISKDPYEEGWLVKIKIEDEKDLSALLSADQYTEFVEASKEEDEDDDDDIDEDDMM